MRYGWEVKGRPNHCACGKTNSMDHNFICKLGGHTSMRMRQTAWKTLEAQIMRNVYRDVQICFFCWNISVIFSGNILVIYLSVVLKVTISVFGLYFERKVNTADNARLDISAKRLWNSCEKTFFDVRITHPTSHLYSVKCLLQIYQQHEKEKDQYNQRVIDIEKSSFNPLVFTTSGGMALECSMGKKTERKNK